MLDEYMNSIGYNEEQINLILNSYPLNTLTESTILYNMKNTINYFHRNSLKNEDIIFITTTIPNLLVSSSEDIKLRIAELNKLGFNKIEIFNMIKNYPYIIQLSLQKIINKFNYLKGLGFNDNNIINIFISKPDIISIDNNVLKKRISFFIDYGFTIDNIINIISIVPDVIDIKITSINKTIELFTNYGFKKGNIINIISELPNLFIYKEEPLELLNNLELYGFSNKDVINIVSKIPFILRKIFFNKIDSKLSLFKELEFNEESIISMSIINPYILLYSDDKIRCNINCLENFYSHNEVINMISSFPLILGYDINNLKNKLKFYKKHELDRYICNNSNLLEFSLELMEARAKVIMDKNINVTFYKDLVENNSTSTLLIDNLFLNEEDFLYIYNLSTNDLLKEIK